MTARPPTMSTAALLRRRAWARGGLLALTAAAVAVAVATAALVGLTIASASPGARPPGMDAETFAAHVGDGSAVLAQTAPGLILVVVLLAVTAVAQLARLLATARGEESTFARARGLSRRQAWALALPEAALVAVGGAGGGVLLGIALVAVLPREVASLSAPGGGAALGGAVLLALALGAVQLFVSVRSTHGSAGTGRARRAAGAALLVVILLAAAFVVWRVRTVPPGPDGIIDPVAAVAPPVMLLAAALLVLGAFAPATRILAALASRDRGIGPVLPARQASRRLVVHGVAVLLVGFASAQTVFAAASAETWQRLVDDSAAVSAGADLRVDLDPDAASPALIATAAAVPGIGEAVPVLVAPAETGSTSFELVAVPRGAIRTVVLGAGGLDRAALMRSVDFDSAAPSIDGDAAGLRVRVEVTSAQAQSADLVELSAVVVDATGAYGRVRFAMTPGAEATGPVRVLEGSGALPEGTAPWQLVAVIAQLRASLFTPDAEVAVVDIATDTGAALPGVRGTAALDADHPDAAAWLADPPSGAGGAAVPAVLSGDFASRLGLETGDTIDFGYRGSGRSGTLIVSDIVPAVPGASTALAAFTSLEGLTAAMLQQDTSLTPPNSVWARGDGAAAPALSAALGERLVRTAGPGPAASVAGALRPAWVVASAGGIALALVAVLALVQALAAARAGEVAALRAVGVPPRAQGRMRAGELALVAGLALAGGAVAGWFAAALVVPALADAAAPGAASAPGGVAVAWGWAGAGLGVLAIGLAALIAADAVRVGRSATSAVSVEAGR